MDAVGAAKVVEAKCRRCDGRGWYSVEKPNYRTGDAEPQQEQCAACYGTGKVVEAKESLGG